MEAQRPLERTPLQDAGPLVAQRLRSSGELEVLRITKALRAKGGQLEFSGVPARQGSKARSVRVTFTNDGISVAPRFDEATGRIDLFYPDRDHPEVQALLNGKRNRFCYFWRSAHGRQTHAWLLSSPV
jgi:hypothetical protein